MSLTTLTGSPTAPGLAPPDPMTVRVQFIPAPQYFPEHAHGWNQMAYAMFGVLTVSVEGQSFVISPEQVAADRTAAPGRLTP